MWYLILALLFGQGGQSTDLCKEKQSTAAHGGDTSTPIPPRPPVPPKQ